RVSGVPGGRVLVEDLQGELVGPPVLVRMRTTLLDSRCVDCRVLTFAAVLRPVATPISLSASLGSALSRLTPRTPHTVPSRSPRPRRSRNPRPLRLSGTASRPRRSPHLPSPRRTGTRRRDG